MLSMFASLVATAALLPSALQLRPKVVGVRGSGVHLKEIPFDISFLRTAKKALRNALQEQDGILDDDARACVDALSAVNPSLPNPSEDNDLWSGKWTFSCASQAEGVLGRGSLQLDESGVLEMQCDVALDATGTPTTLRASGRVSAVADTVLELQCDSMELEAGATQELVTACSAALNLELKDDAGGGWAATPSPLRLAQLYLDQDMHIVRRVLGSDEDAELSGSPLVMFKAS